MQEILHLLYHALSHALIDSLRLLPFLFVTYFLMEILEHTAGDKVARVLSRSGKVGPLAGGLLGGVPQCGFSAAVAGLYSGGVITTGTLLAVFLSTSDEMIPVMISSAFPAKAVLIILAVKIILAIAVGFLADAVFRKKSTVSISKMCEDEGCRCEKGPLGSALHHTIGVFFFVFAVGFLLESVIEFAGEDILQGLFSSLPVLSNIAGATVGLIPNCASSVVVTELYLEGVVSAGAMMSGLFTGAGVGTLVLFKTNKNIKENLLIILALWVIGILLGILLDLAGIDTLLRMAGK